MAGAATQETENRFDDEAFKQLSSSLEDTEEFAGNELDDDAFDAQNEAGTHANEPNEADGSAPSTPAKAASAQKEDGRTRPKRGKRMLLPIIAGMFLLVGTAAVYLFMTGAGESHGNASTRRAPKTFRIENPPPARIYSITLSPFIIPYANETLNSSYVSLDISIEVANETYWQGILNEKEALRGILFDRLHREINQRTEIPSLEALKNLILETVNASMAVGRVDHVFITNFLVV